MLENPEKKPLKIYQSSAGSGKTYTLVKEYISILLQSENDLKFKQILAVTFTNKAANEMKERVLDSLLLLYKDKDPALLKDYAIHTGLPASQISKKAERLFFLITHQYGYFSILTIDKFVHRVIRSFARELDLSVNFDIESDIDAFLQRSVAALLNLVGSDEALTDYLIQYTEQLLEGDDNQDVEKKLLQLTSLLKEDISKESIKEFKDVDLTFFTKLGNELLKKNALLDQQKKSAAQELLDYMNIHGWGISDFKGGATQGWNKLINNFVSSGVVDGSWDTLVKQYSTDTWFNKSHENLVQQIGEGIRNRMKVILDAETEQQLIREINKQLVGFSLLNSVNRILQEVKGDNNIVFLNDFNTIISKIVQNEPAPFIYEKIGTRFQHFLIDEFQDTSKLQWNNLVPLLFNSLGEGNENLIVGDPKQAIYRWRGGAVEQFVDLPEVKGEFTYLDEINRVFKSAAEVKDLKVNYRSSRSVVQFNNWLFHKLIQQENETIKSIYKGVSQDEHRDNNGYVCFKVIEGSKEETEELSLTLTDEYIVKCLNDGHSYGDIAILVRKKGDGTKVAEYLERKGYPVVSMDSIVLGSSVDVNFIVSFLSSLSDANNEHAQVNCLRYLSGDNSLTAIYEKWKVPNTKEKRYSIGLNFNGYLKSEYTSFDDAYYRTLNLYDRIIYIIELFGINRYQPYVDQLLNTVHSFLQRNNSNVNAFVTYFEEQKDKIPVNIGGSFNAIQVMTIHKSKGLQFPIVIIPFGQWKNKNSGTQPLTWIEHQKLKELNLPKFVAPLSKNSLKHYNLESVYEKENQEAILDNLNLFYVAFTRPETRLYVISSYVSSKESISNNILKEITGHEMYNEAEKSLVLGKEEKLIHEKIERDIPVAGVKLKSVRQKIDISFDREAFIEDADSTNEREIGIGVHHVLAKANKIEEVNALVEELVLSGKINVKLEGKIKELVNNAFKMDPIRNCYSAYEEVYNEAEIITESSEFYRPDRVMVNGNEAIVLDFKTGTERKSHLKQVLNYADLLEKMGYKVKKKYLLYVAEPKLIEL